LSGSISPRLAAAAALVFALGACTDELTTPQTAPDEAAAAVAETPGNGPDRYFVVFKPGTRDVPGVARRLAAAHGTRADYIYQNGPDGFAAYLPAPAAEALARNPGVAYVEKARMGEYHQTTQYSPVWGLDRIDQRQGMLNGTYVYGRTGAGVNVYVIDSGIDTTHAEFGGRARTAYDVNGGNGQDCYGHGTHVAGIVGGSLYGVAKSTRLYSVRIGDCTSYVDPAKVVMGINWVRNNHVKPAVVNLSLGFPATQAVDDAVNALVAAGVTVVVSAGNQAVDACTRSPARVSEVITVGASTSFDAPWAYSNFGACVDLYAPGDGVTSVKPGNMIATESGTSQAAPHVAGVAAMWLASNTGNTARGVTASIIMASTYNQLTGVMTGSPNFFLHSHPANNYRKIGNRYQTSAYIHTEGGPLVAGTHLSGWWTSMWAFEPVAGTPYFRIRNRWTGHYLHAEYGSLQAGTVLSGWQSAHWELEWADHHFRIRNRYRGTHLHMEYGSLQLGPINNAWHSAQWRIEDTHTAI
jgi:subtilisin family serine protease